MSTLRCSTLSLVLTSRPCRLPITKSACLRLSTTIAKLNNGDYKRNKPLRRSHIFTKRRSVNFVVHPTKGSMAIATGITPTKRVPLAVVHGHTKSIRLSSTHGSTIVYCATSKGKGTGRCSRTVPFHGNNAMGT